MFKKRKITSMKVHRSLSSLCVSLSPIVACSLNLCFYVLEVGRGAFYSKPRNASEVAVHFYIGVDIITLGGCFCSCPHSLFPVPVPPTVVPHFACVYCIHTYIHSNMRLYICVFAHLVVTL